MDFPVTSAVHEGARDFKAAFIAMKRVKLAWVGRHDESGYQAALQPELDSLRRARQAMFDALAALDGPLPYEDAVREAVRSETGI